MNSQIITLLTSQLLPQPVFDTGEQESRGSPWGDNCVVPFGGLRHNLAGEGSYVVCTTPTPSTGVAYGSAGTQASFSETTGFVIWKNNAPASGQPLTMFLDYLRFIVGGTAPASATSLEAAFTIDTATRAPTANASLLTPVNLNFRSTRGAVGQMWVANAGIPTVPAPVNRRLVGRATLLPAITVVRSEFEVRFGADSVSGPTGVQSVGRYSNVAAPIILGPQEFAIMHLWLPSGATNPLTVEIESGWWER